MITYMFQKHSENFAFQLFIILQYFTREICTIRTVLTEPSYAAQKLKFSIKDFFSKCDQVRIKLRVWSDLLKKSLMQNFIFGQC